MPYPNEHACRLRNPSEFQPNSFRRGSRRHDGKQYDVIFGRLRGEESMTEQAYRYDKTIWSVDDAREHCEAHGGTFEPAREDNE
jgi:hypothetical protein